MQEVSLDKITDKDLEELRVQCNALESKMAKIMLEILEELDHRKCDETLDCDVKEDIKNLTNKIFDVKAEESN